MQEFYREAMGAVVALNSWLDNIRGWGRAIAPAWWLTVVSGFCLAPSVVAQVESDAFAVDQMESVFATALVVTETESATLGFLSFDPQLFTALDSDEYGSEESVERRRNVRAFALPWRWQLSEGEALWQSHVKARLSYLEFRQDLVLGTSEGSSQDRHKDVIYGGYIEKGWGYAITDEWKVEAGFGMHLLRYQNRYSYDSPIGQAADADIGGILFGSDATALALQVQPRVLYASDGAAGIPWAFQSVMSYYLGRTIDSGDIQPETWSWSNGVSVRWDLPDVFATSNQLQVSARRIDIGGDVVEPFGTHEYYQFSVGWLFETDNGWSWLDNLGLSVALNIGSALSGGSLVLLYNEREGF